MVDSVKKTLVIVESPTKAKTLARFLGHGYQIEATMGHVRDLPKASLGVDVEHEFKPEYVAVERRAETIRGLKKLAKEVKEVILATDPDREGESIAWHTAELLGIKKADRIVFHEITKTAIEEALSHPGQVDLKLVDAQQARRVLDRLVGYKLSPLLWKKVRRGLSAGRVQSVTVRLIVDREKEIAAFKAEEYWQIRVKVDKAAPMGGRGFWLDLIGKRIKNEQEAKTIKADLEKAEYVVEGIEKKSIARASLPPFKTSTLQQAAAGRMGWSSKRTMRAAQALYERGLITYHRTDSLNLAAEAVRYVRGYINSTYGKEYVPQTPRYFKSSSKLAQEAHEAIRPTDVACEDEDKLYQLIRRRFVASQMAEARLDKTTINVSADKYSLRAEGIRVVFDGWRRVYGGEIEEVVLPQVSEGDRLVKEEVVAEQKFTQPPARFSEATLIKTLEKLGIGRPSTYAPTISTIQVRQYVEKKEQKFYPTPVGMAVTQFLFQYFPQIMDYEFTAGMEDSLDKIASGEQEWVPVIDKFYRPFEKDLSRVEKKAERVKVETEKTGDKCPKCKQGDVVIRVGRFGKFLSCSRFPECDYKDKYVEIVEGVKCQKCGNPVVVRRTKTGRFFYGCSTYPKCSWASWHKPKTPAS